MSTANKPEMMRVRFGTKQKIEAFASRNRLPIVEAADIAADLLASLTPEQEREIIQRPNAESVPDQASPAPST